MDGWGGHAPGRGDVMTEVVVMVGLPGCGKSAWVKRHLAASHVVVSRDLWPNALRRDLRRRRAIGDALADGLDVVVDDINPSPLERAPVISIAREHGARVRAVYIDRPLRECLERNAARSGPAAVPVAGVLAAARRLVRPTPGEGFDQVDTVEEPDEAGTVEEPDDSVATLPPGS